jgi:hypothetical protein
MAAQDRRQSSAPIENRFVAQVVELEHNRIGLTAIDARMCPEVLEEVGRALEPQPLFLDSRLLDVARAVRLVVLPPVCRPAQPAEAVSLSAGLPLPGEFIVRFDLSTPLAPP